VASSVGQQVWLLMRFLGNAALWWQVTPRFPQVLISDRGGDLVNRTSNHTSPATRYRGSSWTKTPVIRGVLAHDDGIARARCHRRRLLYPGLGMELDHRLDSPADEAGTRLHIQNPSLFRGNSPRSQGLIADCGHASL
jgi:hypothetical protein